MGKSENLRKLLDKNGRITIAALDHRGSLKQALNPNNPEQVTEEEMKQWKRRMVELYQNEVSGILIDPIYGKELIDTNQPCGWMLSMEKTGYRGGKLKRETEILPDWSVELAKEMGAAGVKLLLYYDPKNRELASKQKAVAERIAADCEREGTVFLLEPLSYGIEEAEREQTVLATARELTDLNVDIFKFEYPGTRAACEEIGKIVNKPWVLLSAGMKYDKYKEALKIACESGASGFAVGRAVWQEFGQYQGPEREKYLTEVALPRMRELVGIVENCGKKISL